MRSGTTISVIGHGLILASGLWWFSAKPLDQMPVESVLADVISESEFSQLTAGLQTAPQSKAPQPIIDKLGAPSEPVKDPSARVTDKPEIKTTVEAAPSAAPPKPAEPKPPAIPPPPPSEAKAEAPTPETDAIAEALKRDEAKKREEARKLEEAKREARRREEARKREERKLQEKIETALLDKREPQRMAATGALVNATPALGAPAGNAPALSQREIEALQRQLHDCWKPPDTVLQAKGLVVTVRFSLNRDGSLAGEPVVVNHEGGYLFQIAAETATRAVRICQPFRLPVSKYEAWQELEGDFRPEDKLGG
jgi:colicin import membrane protein